MINTILQPGNNCSDVFAVEHTGVLIDGRDYYKAFYEAARQASRYILIAGWQFDSDVPLLRGPDLNDFKGEVRFIPFLNELCIEKPELKIYILAWDFSMVFAMEREWLQEMVTNWSTSERLLFRFDNSQAVGGSHHQKLVVIDGLLAFAGGMDICSSRWDDRRHLSENPERKDADGVFYGPYHEIQIFLSGPIVQDLTKIFETRWRDSGGEDLNLGIADQHVFDIGQDYFPLATKSAALSQTGPRTLVPLREPILEIRSLYLDAIRNAENLIYLENQYFSSQSIYQAFVERMSYSERPPLQVIIILPMKSEGLVEELSMGLTQGRMLNSLKEIARRRGHSLGIYYSASISEEKKEVSTYIHSKLLLVDDRFLTIGSANTTNRSMGLDTELNVSWEADPFKDTELMQSIRGLRVSLIAEHAGWEDNDEEKLRPGSSDHLVGYLDYLADRKTCRLRRHIIEDPLGMNGWLEKLELNQVSLDLDRPILEENIFEVISQNENGILARGTQFLNKWLFECRQNEAKKAQCLETANGNDKFYSFLIQTNPAKLFRRFKLAVLLFFLIVLIILSVVLLR